MSATLTPRASEVAVVAEILDSGVYDDAEQMAKQIVRAVGAELAKRDAFLVVVPDGAFCYGPYWTPNQAKTAWEKQIGPNVTGAGRIVHSFSWDGRKGDE